MAEHRLTSHTIDDEATLRDLIGFPKEIVARKVINHLNPLTSQFIQRSPLVCLATSDAQGNCDLSPRGDPPGFVRILDDRTLLIPERPGNKLADTLRNILANPHIGILFIVPGVTETFRVNGRATLITDAALLADSAVEGKLPKLGILVDIHEAYTQCSKAFLRSDFFNPERFLARKDLPSNGEIMCAIAGVDPTTYDEERAERYARREGFY